MKISHFGFQAAIGVAVLAFACASSYAADVEVEEGYAVEHAVTGMWSPVGIAFHPQTGDAYVAEAGVWKFTWGGLCESSLPSGSPCGEDASIWKVDPQTGQRELVQFTGEPFENIILALSFDNRGNLYISDATPATLSPFDPAFVPKCTIKKGKPGGALRTIFETNRCGEHQINKVVFDHQGRLVFGLGTATDDGSPYGSTLQFLGIRGIEVPCTDLDLTDLNGDNISDNRWIVPLDSHGLSDPTGPYQPLGSVNAFVEGKIPCTGAILRMPADPPVTLNDENAKMLGMELVAWGFRNPFGIAYAPEWHPLQGGLVVTNNGADYSGPIRGIVNDEDAMWVVNDDDSEIEWAGWPDFFGGSRYVTNALNTVQRDLGPGPIGPVFGGGQLPLIDLDKTRSLVPDFPKRRLNPLYVGVQGVSMNGFDFVSTDKFGAKGDILVAEYGQYYNPLSLNRHELEFCLDGDGRADASLCEDYEHEGHVVRRIHLVTINNHVVGTSSRVFLKHSHDQNGGVHGLFPVDLKFDKKGTKAYVVNMGFDFTDPGGFAPHGEILEVTRSVN